MGRWGTGAITSGEAERIELSYLLRQGLIRKGHEISGMLSWTNGNSIGIASTYNKDKKQVRLNYTITYRDSGRNEDCEYIIQLNTIPSNLGRGEIVYFVCPITGRRARILYKCYGSKIWKSRGAYRSRIYYETQQTSKLWYHNTRYWALQKALDKFQGRSIKNHYRGNETRLRKRIRLLRKRQEYHDWLRWIFIPKALQKGLNPEMLKFLAKARVKPKSF